MGLDQTFFIVLSEGNEKMPEFKDLMNRRDFLKAAASAVGTGITVSRLPIQYAIGEEPEKMRYRRLGRTNLMVSEIVAANDWNRVLYQPALDMGINYWHKAGYWRSLPREFAKIDRESYYTDDTVDTLDYDDAIRQTEERLKRSGVKYFDFFKVHSMYRSVEDIKKETGILKAFEHLKKQGKVRYLACSHHSNIPEICSAMIESGLFDALQPAFSFGAGKDFLEMLELAKKHDVGIICMKTMHGLDAFKNSKELMSTFGPEGMPARALLRWILSVPGVTACVPLHKNFDQFNENMGAAVGKRIAYRQDVINHYASRTAKGGNCYFCGACEKHCPQNIRVADILRYSMYHKRQDGLQSEARFLYAQLSTAQRVENCAKCGVCEESCPYDLPIMSLLTGAHTRLA
jgi:predicted aldo/keto reductase-like oxidoreductase